MHWICNTHNKNIQFICLNQTCPQTRILFLVYLNWKSHIPSKDVKEIQNFYKLLQQESDESTYQLNEFGLLFNEIKLKFQLLIDEIGQGYHVTESQFLQLNSDQINDLTLSLFKLKTDIDFIENTISENFNRLLESINYCIDNLELQQNNSKFHGILQHQTILKYELINSIKADDVYAFAFDNLTQQLVAGYSSSTIKVFEFQEGKLNPLQELNNHNSFVYCLYFMKKSQCFLSGSGDKQIILWSKNENLMVLQIEIIGTQ